MCKEVKRCVMGEIPNSFMRTFEIGISSCNSSLSVKPSAMQDMLVDTSMSHSIAMGTGYYELLKKNLMWVITEMEMHFVSYPKFTDTINIKTWPTEPKMLSTDRNYEVYDRAGKIIGNAVSTWCVLDANTRKLTKIKECGEHSITYLPAKYEKSNFNFCDINKLAYFAEDKVIATNLDGNGHMNNICYVSKILDHLSQDELNKFTPKSIHMKFIHEMKNGETIAIYHYVVRNRWYFELRNKETNATTFQIIFEL